MTESNFDQFGLDRQIVAGVKAMGYTTPTPIQQQAIPVVLEGRDVLGIAQTGTGKTAAFMLPILQRLMKGPRGTVRALVLAPTRELADQTYDVTRLLGQHTRTRAVTVYGGVSKLRQVEALRQGAEVVIACPGRLLDILADRDIDLARVEVLVLDEADRMCDMGFLPDIKRILQVLPRHRQTLFFAATMPEEIRKLADSILHNPATVQVGIVAPAATVSHAFYPVEAHLKSKLLAALMQATAMGRVLVFTRTKHRASKVARELGKLGHRVAALQGNMSQNARQAALDGFREGKFDVLVATDIASRGIDVTEISHVINYDMPDTVDAYIHRIGRTGRAAETGEACTFLTPEDEEMTRAVERVLPEKVERRWLEGFDYDAPPEPKGLPRPLGSRQRQPGHAPHVGHGERAQRREEAPRVGGRATNPERRGR